MKGKDEMQTERTNNLYLVPYIELIFWKVTWFIVSVWLSLFHKGPFSISLHPCIIKAEALVQGFVSLLLDVLFYLSLLDTEGKAPGLVFYIWIQRPWHLNGLISIRKTMLFTWPLFWWDFTLLEMFLFYK